MPWYSSQTLFWVLSCLLLSWPLRILIECNTSYVHYTVTKIFGVNYDLETTRRLDLETHNSQYMPPVCNFPRPPATSILSTQSAILANNMETPSSSTQHINILALARSRNGLEPGEAMSHTSTIDSLELFATIRENCVLVPSYSEALLLSSLQLSSGNIPASVKSAISNLSNDHNTEQSSPAIRGNNTNEILANSELDSVIHKCLNSLKPTQHHSQKSLPSTSSDMNIDMTNNQDSSTDNLVVLAPEVESNDQVRRNSADQCTNASAIIENNVNTPRRTISIKEKNNVPVNIRVARAVEMDDTAETAAKNETATGNSKYSPFGMHTTQSNYSLRTGNNNSIFTRRENNHVLDKTRAQNRKSWAGFLTKPVTPFGHYNKIYGSARIRPVPLLSSRRNSNADSVIKQSDETLILTESVEEQAFIENGDASNEHNNVETPVETEIPAAQIESIDRNLGDRNNADLGKRNLFFSSPLLEVCPTDPLGGRIQTTPTEDPPPYEVAINLPVLRRITRSITDRGELFGQSRAFINDTLMNRRSCVDDIISGADSVRLIQHSVTSRERDNVEMETNL